MPIRDIGIDVVAPKREPAPGDRMNPFNGTLPVRGSVIVGTIVSAKMQHTTIVEKQHERLVAKFERIEKRTRRYAAHVPSNIDVHVGDEVVIAECRPLSKTVNFVVVENRGNPAERRMTDAGAPSAHAQRLVAAEAAHAKKVKPKAAKTDASEAKPAAKKAAAPKKVAVKEAA